MENPTAVKTKENKTRRKKPNTSSYGSFIYRVLKQTSADTGISKKAMSIMDSFVMDIFDRICTEAGRLARYNKKHTISSREVQSSVALVLKGELAKHAKSAGVKACTTFSASRPKKN